MQDAKPLGLVRVEAASTGEVVTALLQRLPDLPTTAGLVTEIEKFAALPKDSQLNGAYGASWTLAGKGGDPRQR